MFRNTLLSRMGVALVLSIGVSVAWGLIVLWGGMITAAIFPNQGTYQRIVYGSNGTPVIETATYYATQPSEYKDLDGGEYSDSDEDWRNTMYESANLVPIVSRDGVGRIPVGSHISVFHSTTQPATLWYFIHSGTETGGGWFQGYSAETRRFTGYIGVNGPTATRPEGPDRFQVPPGAMNYNPQWSEQNYYRYLGVSIPPRLSQAPSGPLARVACVPVTDNVLIVDLRNGDVRKLLPDPQQVRAMQLTRHADRRSKDAKLLVETDRSVLVFNDRLQQVAEFRLPDDDDSGYLTLLTAGDGSTWAVSYFNVARQLGSKVRVLHWTADGELPTSRVVDLKNAAVGSQDAWFAAVSLAVPSPITLTATVFGFAPYTMWNTQRVPWSEAVARCFAAGAGPALVVVWLLGAAAAFLTWRHSRREDAPLQEVYFWTAFVLLLGPAAYLGYRFHRRWPRQLPCPAGGHTLPADHFDCPTCHTAWPLPAMKGIEVLEPAKA
ncbi:hypothetical protein [Planctellipticum variicoloris]|uniref:hypothetical protein n=1 Tax=Planctellipticum variicoloris TaxID=3064265 RepID=UPI003013C78A|nr:hypothetical protein SH412_004979 [Planctomycetaceae bacterium SH412]